MNKVNKFIRHLEKQKESFNRICDENENVFRSIPHGNYNRLTIFNHINSMIHKLEENNEK